MSKETSEGNKYIYFLLYQYVHYKPWQMSGRYAKTVNFRSNLTGYCYIFHYSGWTYVQHNWLEIVCCPAVIVSSAVWWALNCYMCEHSCFEHIYEHFGILSITPIFCFSMKSLYLKHHFSHSIYVSAFGTIAQCICAFWTQQVLSSCDTILLTLESQIIAPGTPVNQAIKTFGREQSSNQGQF